MNETLFDPRLLLYGGLLMVFIAALMSLALWRFGQRKGDPPQRDKQPYRNKDLWADLPHHKPSSQVYLDVYHNEVNKENDGETLR